MAKRWRHTQGTWSELYIWYGLMRTTFLPNVDMVGFFENSECVLYLDDSVESF